MAVMLDDSTLGVSCVEAIESLSVDMCFVSTSAAGASAEALRKLDEYKVPRDVAAL